VSKNSSAYTLGFAAAVCIICSLLVSTAAVSLKDKQDQNVRIDIQKNILGAVGFLKGQKKVENAEIEALYNEHIVELVVARSGEVVPDKAPSALRTEDYLDHLKSPAEFPLYVRKDNGKPVAYAFPIVGKGLWSTLYGYLALETDANTVKGISFYKHGETPGLGAEIEKTWFQSNYIGKKVLARDGSLASVTVIKGKVADLIAAEQQAHYVDGISGATITSRGVTELVRLALERYGPVLRNIRKGTL
jgi:Na+-transporting NADH:ubiquinone oxidoreductase subunit C